MSMVFGQNSDVDATAERLTPSTVKFTKSVTISNPNAAGTVYLGNSDQVTATNGFPLPAGATVSVGVTMVEDGDLTNLWVIGSGANLVVGYIGQ